MSRTWCVVAGDYGSDSESEGAPQPKVKQEPLPLPDAFTKREIKAEPAAATHSPVKVAEEVDYDEDSDNE